LSLDDIQPEGRQSNEADDEIVNNQRGEHGTDGDEEVTAPYKRSKATISGMGLEM
jgi:hypothetical protein